MKSEIQLKIDIVERVIKKLISKSDAANILSVSVRTIERYEAGFKTEGIQFFIHGNSHRAPANKIDVEILSRAKALVKEKYFDFNMTHCLEKLNAEEKIKINRETFRKECHSINIASEAVARNITNDLSVWKCKLSLAIIDYNLPGTNGAQLARRFLKLIHPYKSQRTLEIPATQLSNPPCRRVRDISFKKGWNQINY